NIQRPVQKVARDARCESQNHHPGKTDYVACFGQVRGDRVHSFGDNIACTHGNLHYWKSLLPRDMKVPTSSASNLSAVTVAAPLALETIPRMINAFAVRATTLLRFHNPGVTMTLISPVSSSRP